MEKYGSAASHNFQVLLKRLNFFYSRLGLVSKGSSLGISEAGFFDRPDALPVTESTLSKH